MYMRNIEATHGHSWWPYNLLRYSGLYADGTWFQMLIVSCGHTGAAHAMLSLYEL